MNRQQSMAGWQVPTLAVACAFAIASLYYVQPIVPLIGASYGLESTAASQAVTLVQVGYALGLLFFVPIGDRIDRRRLILTLLAVNTAANGACAAAPSFAVFAVAIVLVGLTTVTPQIIIPTVAGMASQETRGRSVGILLSGMSAGVLLGRAGSGILGEFAGWRTVFALAATLNLLLMAMIYRYFPATAPSSDLPYPRLLQSMWQLLKAHATLRYACATGFLAFAAFSVLWATLAVLLGQAPYAFGAGLVGLFGLIGIVSIVMAPVLGRLTDRYGTGLMIGAGYVMLFTAFAFVSRTEFALWALMIGIALIDVGYRSVLLANQARIYPLHPSAQSRLNTVFMTSVFVGGAFGAACGALAMAWSWPGVAVVGAVCSLAGMLIHLWSARRRPG